jgi:hypothetical protein
MAGLDDCNILQSEHLVRNRLGGTNDSISVPNLRSHVFACTSSQVMSNMTKEHLAWHDLRETRVFGGTRYPCNLGRSRSLNVWSGEPRLKCDAVMTLKLITQGKTPKLDKLSEVLIWVIKGFKCSTNSVHDAHSIEHLARNHSVKNPNCPNQLVCMTLVHDDFECPSPSPG